MVIIEGGVILFWECFQENYYQKRCYWFCRL